MLFYVSTRIHIPTAALPRPVGLVDALGYEDAAVKAGKQWPYNQGLHIVPAGGDGFGDYPPLVCPETPEEEPDVIPLPVPDPVDDSYYTHNRWLLPKIAA